MILILKESDPEVEKCFRRVAEANRERIYFIYSIDGDYPELHTKLSEYLGANFVTLPAIFITEPIGHKTYLFKGDFTEENL